MNRILQLLSFSSRLLLVTLTDAPGAAIGIAHRGLAASAPENTVAAFAAAHGFADMIETDVRVTSDGQLVIMHDATVDRTTDGTGAVDAMTLAQLRSLDAGSWYATNFTGQRIPTFAEMITNILPHATPLIEHKAGTATAYVNALQQLGVSSNVMVQSFEWPFLKAVHLLDPGIPLCALAVGPMSYDMLAGAVRNGAGTVAWYKVDVTADGVNLAHSLGLSVFVWTVAAPEIPQYLAMGVDGIITDAPEQVILAQQPVPEADVVSISSERQNPNRVGIEVRTRGLATSFSLLYAESLFGSFQPVSPLDMSILGRDRFIFKVSPTNSVTGYFRAAAD